LHTGHQTGDFIMAFALIPLPYDKEALAPAISADTLAVHHGKHHQAYIDKTNELAAADGLGDADLETVIARARGGNKKLFNNAAQAWNHGFYWHSLSPAAIDPSGALADRIEADFGSLDALRSELVERGTGHFASGWVWLASKGGKLSVEETHDGDTLADSAEAQPLLTIDLWEHAYYLDYKNKRPDHLKAVIERHLNWDFAAENLARGANWQYPADAVAERA
jgi:Fe-Mn family superoxide dismutase